ncbi:hypothetical protein [Streptomyces aureoverticillatus]|uniref:hypothetical protein n=1 Tax=Streptomyces aureoverticillatus TaxID=66871 RepID=UPI0013DD30AD|nr:hypothetical protein [Streptomyces aureoverticillatus]QIB45885.1 hypothetical protein G3H79_25235 [Streptomyces aureoverticillatus]
MRRPRRVLVVVTATAAAGLGLAACDPVEGDMSTSAVAITTDKMGTLELERQHAEVDWITCTASFIGRDKKASESDEPRDAEVDCRGQTDDDKVITIRGRVTDVSNGACVRGNLTARIGGEEWFRVDVLGNCDSKPNDDNANDNANDDNDNANDDNGDQGNDSGNDSGDNGHDDGNGNGGNDDNAGHDEPDPGPTATVTVTERPGEEQGK